MTPFTKLSLVAATTALLSTSAFAQDGGFRDCLQGIKTEATRQGVPAAIADKAFQGLTPDQKVIDLDGRQPEFSLTYAKYVGGTVSADRIAKGQQKMAQHRALLDALQAEYGVPPQYIMAFWGIETNYGTYMGDFRVVRSVATLGCMTKRTAFFSNETVQALRILNMNHMTSEQMRGSWAGAMGNMQFMPSTFTKWAVDRDGNGKIDIWNSLPDAFASAANFLRGIGFKPGLPSSEEVFLPKGFPLDQADSTVEKPVKAWTAMGVKKAGGAALPASDEPASILLPAGFRPLQGRHRRPARSQDPLGAAPVPAADQPAGRRPSLGRDGAAAAVALARRPPLTSRPRLFGDAPVSGKSCRKIQGIDRQGFSPAVFRHPRVEECKPCRKTSSRRAGHGQKNGRRGSSVSLTEFIARTC
ncbi:MAG: lytic murein transglycosylase [Rhodospirillales bacterium]|nr:lytic murein transglycosylase [Rhodospirillales bacterium]